MFIRTDRNYLRHLGWFAFALAAVASFLYASPAGPSSTRAAMAAEAAPTPTPEMPVYSGYRGVKIGMPAADARSLLGKARDTSEFEDYFVFSDKETVQVLYENKMVKAISVNYVGADAGAPTPKDVFGADVEPKPDGSIYKMVKYPKAGFWLMYNRTSGDDPLIMITIQKLPPGQ
ncbi:MAG: hypothetical protein ACK4S4_05275 [Pyrinomonadaceae bacterium]